MLLAAVAVVLPSQREGGASLRFVWQAPARECGGLPVQLLDGQGGKPFAHAPEEAGNRSMCASCRMSGGLDCRGMALCLGCLLPFTLGLGPKPGSGEGSLPDRDAGMAGAASCAPRGGGAGRGSRDASQGDKALPSGDL